MLLQGAEHVALQMTGHKLAVTCTPSVIHCCLGYKNVTFVEKWPLDSVNLIQTAPEHENMFLHGSLHGGMS